MTISVKFIYRSRYKKVSLPVFKAGSHEEFLRSIQYVDNWVDDYNLKILNKYMKLVLIVSKQTEETTGLPS